MAVLHNRISQKELKERLYQETEPRITLSFYRYFTINEPGTFRNEMYAALNRLQVFGRIYIAHEGINAQLSIPQSHFESLKIYLESIGPLKGMRLNIAVDDESTDRHFAGQSVHGLVDAITPCSDTPGPDMEVLPVCSSS